MPSKKLLSKKRTILIAGGGGFIGTNLTTTLLKKGHQVIILDNFVTSDKKNLDHLKKHPNLTLIEHDITKPLPKINTKIDAIANLASPASPPRYQKIPIFTLRTNSLGTENLLKLAKKHNCRFVQASTSEIYGNPEKSPQKETYFGNVNSYGPRSMYDEGKRYAESLIKAYRDKFKLNTGIIRIFNTYGPFMQLDDGRVITNFINQILNKKPLTIHGDGKQTRSFCYIDDQVSAWLKMIDSDIEGPVNIGNTHEITVNQLAKNFEKALKVKLEKVYISRPPEDPEKRRPDVSLAKKLLKWEPKVSLEQGLKKTYNWYKKNQPTT
jgi:nucleoside-diphosphate-sugar epimerase